MGGRLYKHKVQSERTNTKQTNKQNINYIYKFRSDGKVIPLNIIAIKFFEYYK